MNNIAISPERFKDLIVNGHIPDAIINVVNNMLIANYKGDKSITINQDELVSEICRVMADTMIDIGNKHLQPFNRNMIFNCKWLDFENLYRQKGWKVEYDKPAYCETYPAYWKFTLPDM